MRRYIEWIRENFKTVKCIYLKVKYFIRFGKRARYGQKNNKPFSDGEMTKEC